MYPLSVDDRKRATENVDTVETFSHGRLPLSSQSSRQAAVTGATWTRAILAHTPTGDFFEFLQLSLVILHRIMLLKHDHDDDTGATLGLHTAGRAKLVTTAGLQKSSLW